MEVLKLLFLISLFRAVLSTWKEEENEEYNNLEFKDFEDDYFDELSDKFFFGDNKIEKVTKFGRKIIAPKTTQISNEIMKTKKNYQNVLPCSCVMVNGVKYLGNEYFPKQLNSFVCTQNSCANLYKCKARYYQVEVLKRKDAKIAGFSSKLPRDLKPKWISENVNVIVGCDCILED